MFIDTHTHLYSEEFLNDQKEVIQRAVEKGVTKVFLPNINLETIPKMNQMTIDFPGICYAMLGLHPSYITKDWKKQLEYLKKESSKQNYIGIGEIGIDLYWDKSLKNEQIEAFSAQIRWAKEVKLPVSIHCRNAFEEMTAVIDAENDENLSGVFHCFMGTEEQAQKLINYGGFKLGIGGVVTFKNSGLDKVLEKIDLQHLVLETDAPYLSPTPFRGKRNESAYLSIIAQKLSAVYGVSEEKIGEITSQNALSVFNSPFIKNKNL